jgi:RNA polymerase sigma-70 factor (ECF subfamily)
MQKHLPNVDQTRAAAPGSGSPASWVDEHGDALYRFALLRVRDAVVAEDLVQEAFLAALKSQAGFAGRSQLRTWLIGILRHKIVDHLRKSGAERESAESDESDSLIDNWFDADGRWVQLPSRFEVNPAKLAERREFWDVLRSCLEGLPDRVGEAFSLRVISDLPANEVCKLLSVTSTNLWVLLHRARARLRACLEKKWFGGSTDRPA